MLRFSRRLNSAAQSSHRLPTKRVSDCLSRHARSYTRDAQLLSVRTVPDMVAPKELVASDAQRRTIFALATPPGKAGVAVVRISGPNAMSVWKGMVRAYKHKGSLPEPWKMERCRIVHPNDDTEQLDDGLAVYFRGPRSFTTEDVVELHLHSGRAIVASVLNALAKLPLCRPAEAGEFTRRAFLGGRLDITQVEGLKDLINAETESQRRIAMIAAGGTARAHFDELRSGIIGCLANVEALIDFGEGEDIEDGIYEQARSRAQDLLASIQRHLQDNRRGEIIHSGVRLAIFGPPNAGKSSLLNFLAHREAAIVTSIPGTTRDILELSLDIGGLPVIVADTAGVRVSDDLVENIGIERAKNTVHAADISLCVLSLPDALIETSAGSQLQLPRSLDSLITPDTLFLFNKSDLASSAACNIVLALSSHTAWTASLSTGAGTADFLSSFAKVLQHRFDFHEEQKLGEIPLITRERHRVHLESAHRFLQAFLDTSPSDIVLGAEELRYAAQALGRISGLIDVEDILDAVFKDFCIGK